MIFRKAKRCVYCGDRGFLTKDHILPRRTGAGLITYGDVRNWKTACAPCNQQREHANDCAAVMLMARGVGRDAKMKSKHVLVAWGFIGTRNMQKHRAAQLAEAMAARRGAMA